MVKSLIAVVLVFALPGCSGMRWNQASDSPCTASPASYACQVDAYQRAP